MSGELKMLKDSSAKNNICEFVKNAMFQWKPKIYKKRGVVMNKKT